MSTANYVNQVLTTEDRPSCHVCGAEMVPVYWDKQGERLVMHWKCLSCETTTGCI